MLDTRALVGRQTSAPPQLVDTGPRVVAAVVAVFVLSVGLLIGPLASPARAEGTAATFDVDATLAADGSLQVTQTMTFDGELPAEVSQKFETRENLVGDRMYVFDISEVTATADGAELTSTVETDGSFETVTLNTAEATGPIELSYTVTGATVHTENGGEAGTALRWRFLQGLSADVEEFTASVKIPGQFTYLRCTAGAPNSQSPCKSAMGGTDESHYPTFTDGPRGQGEVVGVDIGFPSEIVAANEKIDYRWTVGRAFSAAPLPLGITLGLLVLGGVGLFGMHRRIGTDAADGGTIHKVGEFTPVGEGLAEFRVVGDIRPGHVGTVADERVDPVDITASLIDLAVRGQLLITELPKTSEFARTDWTISRVADAPTEGLHPFETALLDGVAPVGGETLVSEIGGKVHEAIGDVQSALYDEMVSNGWYEQRPDATRNKWTQLAFGGLIAAVVITGVLAAFTTFALIGVALIVLGLGLVFVAQEMPSRTHKGAALLAGLGALRSDLVSHPTDQMPPGQELRELSEVVPYAVVLGGADRWLDAIVATDDEDDADSTDLSWYHGPDNWHLRDLPDSLRNFITTVSGTLFAR